MCEFADSEGVKKSEIFADVLNGSPLMLKGTGWSKRNGTKIRKLSQNFPKLADWAVHWQVTLLGRTWGGNFQTGNISFAQPCIAPFILEIRPVKYQ